MKCPNCHTAIDVPAKYCSQCGYDLQAGPKNRLPRATVFFGILVGVAIILSTLALWQSRMFRPSQRMVGDVGSQQRQNGSGSTPDRKPVQYTDTESTQSYRLDLPVGTVIIEDITGSTVTKSSVPVIDNGWIALPLKSGRGGFRWRMLIRDVREMAIEGGVFRDYDTVGLWQIAAPVPVRGPELKAWNEDESIDWVSLDTGKRLANVKPRDCVEEGYFVSCALPAMVSGSGVFFQGDRAVGWTFDAGAKGGFFWNGRDGQRLRMEVHVDDYYRLTFADSREEKFLLALADDRQSDLQRLENLVTAFQYPKKLAESDTPDRLRAGSIHSVILKSIQGAASQGDAAATIDLFDRGVLLEIDDIDILLAVSQETGKVYGAAAALELLEGVRDYISTGKAEDSGRLNAFHRELILQHLEELASIGDWDTVSRRFDIAQTYFPDDPEIYLFGVRLTLFDGEWREAERLLYTKNYPSSLSVQVADINKEIQELKGMEGRIVIRFSPGATNIPVQATVNGEMLQDFLIDTGASTVTIPSSTVRRLGIPTDTVKPKKRVYTAGGQISAREVILDSIEINGWSVGQVKALVIDIPNRPGLGLLGLNYLDRFNVDMRPEEGVLTLTPR